MENAIKFRLHTHSHAPKRNYRMNFQQIGANTIEFFFAPCSQYNFTASHVKCMRQRFSQSRASTSYNNDLQFSSVAR